MIRVSVIVPCYNREKLLPATLESVRGQTFADWECVVVDDGSEDGSLEAAQRFVKQDSRFRVIGREGNRRGANACRNQGLKLAQGEYVVFLDSDDLLGPACLGNRVEAMQAAPECGFGVFITELFRERVGDRRVLWNIYTEANDLSRFLSKDLVWNTTSPIWRRQVLASLEGFDEDLLSFQDWDLHVRALSSGIPYFRNETRDHFYRNGYKGSSAISTVSTIRGDHLRSHERLFVKTTKSLRAAGLLDDDHRCRVAGLFWWLAKCRLNGAGTTGMEEAVGGWRRALDLQLCSRLQYVEGCLLLGLYSIRGFGRLANVLQHWWPSGFHCVGSEHLHRAPMNGLQIKSPAKKRFGAFREESLVFDQDGLALRR